MIVYGYNREVNECTFSIEGCAVAGVDSVDPETGMVGTDELDEDYDWFATFTQAKASMLKQLRSKAHWIRNAIDETSRTRKGDVDVY